MKRFLILLFIFVILLSTTVRAHPWKPDHYVIIDTDCGFDDYRAINLMLSSSNIRVLAIITSNGVVNAQDGYLKVKSLLKQNYQEGILVGVNPNLTQIARNCDAALNFNWAETMQNEINQVDYMDVLNQVFDNCTEQVTFINMGGLNTIHSYLENNPIQIEKIKEIVWTCNQENLKGSFNFQLDTLSFNNINNKKLKINYINGDSFGAYTSELIHKIGMDESQLAKNIHQSLSISTSPFTKLIYDESAFFYLVHKQIFSKRSLENDIEYSLLEEVKLTSVYIDRIERIIKIQNQVLSDFPMDTSDYISDIQIMMESTIKSYGKEEWAACVLTSELHRHLGVFSLIGAKMGVRAKEYFGAGNDELRIVSYAGLVPPFSCLNDGLQVSTGATIGHGLISVNENNRIPMADFYYMGRKITLSLKEEYRLQIAAEIKELSIIYGLDSNIYWDLVRNLAIKYWANWDRHNIFEITEQ
jgi:pyrimidine-specific ribonucleoside hydrolase